MLKSQINLKGSRKQLDFAYDTIGAASHDNGRRPQNIYRYQQSAAGYRGFFADIPPRASHAAKFGDAYQTFSNYAVPAPGDRQMKSQKTIASTDYVTNY
jgi:hypothetical protein